MRTRTIPFWSQNHARFASLRQVCRNNNQTEFYMALAPKLNDEEFCNMMLTLINQTITMLGRMIDLVKEDFLKNGGMKEQMYQARISRRSGR